jgi:hypothetical protein
MKPMNTMIDAEYNDAAAVKSPGRRRRFKTVFGKFWKRNSRRRNDTNVNRSNALPPTSLNAADTSPDVSSVTSLDSTTQQKQQQLLKQIESSSTQEKFLWRKKKGILKGTGNFTNGSTTSQSEKPKSPMFRRIQGYRISLLCHTPFFKKLVRSAFEIVNDGSNIVNENEVYVGLLLIHLKLGSYAGPLACEVRQLRLSMMLILGFSFAYS